MIKIEWGGSKKQEATLRAVGQRLADLTPAMKVGAEAVDKMIDDCFRKEQDPWGKPWEPLKESTKRARAERRLGKRKAKKGGG